MNANQKCVVFYLKKNPFIYDIGYSFFRNEYILYPFRLKFFLLILVPIMVTQNVSFFYQLYEKSIVMKIKIKVYSLSTKNTAR